MNAPPPDVVAAWGWSVDDVRALPGGLINATFAVHRDGAPVAVLQRLHAVFAAEVNLDLEAVTAHLAARGMTTPRLLRARDGTAWVEHEGVWRALSWVDGVSMHAVPDPSWAEAGGALVGRFHRAVEDLVHDYAFARAGVHDTAAHLERLRRPLAQLGATAELADAIETGHEVLAAAGQLPALPELPPRHCHGDLKISNLMFRHGAHGPEGVCLVDLDTLGRMTLAFELGDAMRSWCNPHREDAAASRFDLAVFAAAMRGYRAEGPRVPDAERVSIVDGLETVCVELAARFCVDAFEDRYFGWDASRYPSRRAHNLARSRGQLALARSVHAQRRDALEIVLTKI